MDRLRTEGLGTMGSNRRFLKGEEAVNKPAAVFAGSAWQKVLARDVAADGQFVYAVKSTGIYCRPSCPSRRPERRNVSFFPGHQQAEAAGFRACLRCEPARIQPRPDPQAEAIARAAQMLSDRAAERTSLEDLAKAAGLGRFALLRGFRPSSHASAVKSIFAKLYGLPGCRSLGRCMSPALAPLAGSMKMSTRAWG